MAGPIFARVSPELDFPKEEREILRFWKERGIFEKTLAKPAPRRPVRLLRGPADGERPAAQRPRPHARHQGPLPSLQDDARLERAAQGRLGHARPARSRSRSRRSSASTARPPSRSTASSPSSRSASSRSSATREEWEDAHRARRASGSTSTTRTSPTTALRRERVVGARRALQEGPPLPGAQGRLVVGAGRHGAQRRRGRAGLQDGRRPERLRRVPARRGDARGPRAPRLDDDAVDPAVEHVRGGPPGARLRRRQARAARTPLRRRARAASRALAKKLGDARRRARAARAASSWAWRTAAVRPVRRRRRSGHDATSSGASSPPTSSRSTRAPASSTSRPRSARTTTTRTASSLRDRPDAAALLRGEARRHVHRRASSATPAAGSRTATRRSSHDLKDARPPRPRRAVPPRLPVLLARRQRSAHPVRAPGLVHPHDGAHRPGDREQPRRPLAARAHQGGPLRRLPREQRRLGALARALLGHAAQRLGLRRATPSTRRRRRASPRSRRGTRTRSTTSTRRGAADPTLSEHLIVHKPWIDQVTFPCAHVRRRRCGASRGHRLLVRLRLHAVRAVGLPARAGLEGALRAELPGRLHQRGDRPDARLVLLAAHDLDARLRRGAAPAPVQDVHRARARLRQGRQEGEQEQGQLHAAGDHPRQGRDGVRRARRRRGAQGRPRRRRAHRPRGPRGARPAATARAVRLYRGDAPERAIERRPAGEQEAAAAASSSSTRTTARRSASCRRRRDGRHARRGPAAAARGARRRSRTRRRPRPAPTRSAGSSTRRARRGRRRATRCRTCARCRRSSRSSCATSTRSSPSTRTSTASIRAARRARRAGRRRARSLDLERARAHRARRSPSAWTPTTSTARRSGSSRSSTRSRTGTCAAAASASGGAGWDDDKRSAYATLLRVPGDAGEAHRAVHAVRRRGDVPEPRRPPGPRRARARACTSRTGRRRTTRPIDAALSTQDRDGARARVARPAGAQPGQDQGAPAARRGARHHRAPARRSTRRSQEQLAEELNAGRGALRRHGATRRSTSSSASSRTSDRSGSAGSARRRRRSRRRWPRCRRRSAGELASALDGRRRRSRSTASSSSARTSRSSSSRRRASPRRATAWASSCSTRGSTRTLLDRGLVHELVNRVQTARKEMGLEYTDRIRVSIVGSERVRAVVDQRSGSPSRRKCSPLTYPRTNPSSADTTARSTSTARLVRVGVVRPSERERVASASERNASDASRGTNFYP